MIGLVLTSLIYLLDLQTHSEEIVLGMSRDKIEISATIDRSEILVFGAVRRETEIAEGTMHVIVTISRPLLPLIVLRKEKTYGIWAKRDMVVVDAAPSFNTVATSRNWDQMLSKKEDLRHNVYIIGPHGQWKRRQMWTTRKAFDTLILILTNNGLY